MDNAQHIYAKSLKIPYPGQENPAQSPHPWLSRFFHYLKHFLCPAVACTLLVPTVGFTQDAILQSINDHVNQGTIYSNYAGWDFRDLWNGGTGNCAALAYTKWKHMQQLGYGDRAVIRTCRLSIGDYHAFVVVDGKWVMDNLHAGITEASTEDCTGKTTDIKNGQLVKWVNLHGDGATPPLSKKVPVVYAISL